MVTPGNALPSGSATRPRIVAACAKAAKTMRERKKNTRPSFDIDAPPREFDSPERIQYCARGGKESKQRSSGKDDFCARAAPSVIPNVSRGTWVGERPHPPAAPSP